MVFPRYSLPLWRVPLVVSSSLSAITREIVKCAPRISTNKIEVTKETKKSEISRIRKQGDRFLSKRKENNPKGREGKRHSTSVTRASTFNILLVDCNCKLNFETQKNWPIGNLCYFHSKLNAHFSEATSGSEKKLIFLKHSLVHLFPNNGLCVLVFTT